MKHRMLAALAVAGITLGAASTADAATWKRVTSATGGQSTDEVGLLRTDDNVLHVAWPLRSGDAYSVSHTVISPSFQIGATTPIVSGWAGTQSPALVQGADGLRAFFGGQRSTVTEDPNNDLNTAVSPDGGATWALQEGSIVPLGGQAYGSPVAATLGPDGQPIQTWAGTLGVWVHKGLLATTPNVDLQGPFGPNGYYSNIASAGGQTYVAWYSNGSQKGVLAQAIDANGNPSGSATVMPGTSGQTTDMGARTPLVARAGGGFYAAYAAGDPTRNRVRLWKIGAGSSRTIARTDGNTYVTVAAAEDGRLWVVWTDAVDGDARVYATRSNEAASRFGAIVDAGRPSGGTSVYSLNGSDAGGKLDLLANYSGNTTDASTWATRILPGLTLKANATLSRSTTKSVRFTVTDAGDAVENAKVSILGRSGRTDEDGRVTLRLQGSGTSKTATATMTGYTKATLKVRVTS
ncbi:MAG: hypothetical protein QOG77_2265 [Solirubrobacteraceae bacterium]|nr:hypothetical protein [Solirubrobacteraceae bacterium]